MRFVFLSVQYDDDNEWKNTRNPVEFEVCLVFADSATSLSIRPLLIS